MDKNESIEKLKSFIGKEVTVYIDRPLGSVHPKHKNIIYGVNYGYIKEFVALDGEYQDAYVLGVNEPIDKFIGKVLCIINRLDDNEEKLVVTKKENDYTNEEIENLIMFQEKFFVHKIIR